MSVGFRKTTKNIESQLDRHENNHLADLFEIYRKSEPASPIFPYLDIFYRVRYGVSVYYK